MKQIVVTNGLLLLMLMIYFILISVFPITISQLNGVLGAYLFIQAIYLFFQRNSTKSFIPIFEKVAIYEKHKMGNEWKKQRQTNFISLFLLSGVMLLNSYLTHGLTDTIFQTDIIFPLFIILLTVIAMVNTFLFLHIKKVDRANSLSDLKGYTRKSNLIGIVVGVIIAVFIFMFIISYVLITNI